MTPDRRILVLQDRVSQLADELQEARDRIASMEEALLSEIDGFALTGLTHKERMLTAFLVKKGRASKTAIHQFLYSHDPQGGAEIKIVDVFICKLRKKLPPGVEIRTLRGEGYEIPPAGRAILRACVESLPKEVEAA